MSSNSVLVVKTISKDIARNEGDFSNEQKELTRQMKGFNARAAFNFLKINAEIIDNRSSVY